MATTPVVDQAPSDTRAYVPARLIALATADGMIEFEDGVPLGRIYRVDLQTRQPVTLYNLDRRCSHRKEMVRAENGYWLPIECLKVLVS